MISLLSKILSRNIYNQPTSKTFRCRIYSVTCSSKLYSFPHKSEKLLCNVIEKKYTPSQRYFLVRQQTLFLSNQNIKQTELFQVQLYNVNGSLDEGSIRNIFESFGELVDVHWYENLHVAIVSFKHENEARNSVTYMNEQKVHGKKFDVIYLEEPFYSNELNELSQPGCNETIEAKVVEGKKVHRRYSVLVENLNQIILEKDIRGKFEMFGDISHIIVDNYSKKGGAKALVHFVNEESAVRAITRMNGSLFWGRKITLSAFKNSGLTLYEALAVNLAKNISTTRFRGNSKSVAGVSIVQDEFLKNSAMGYMYYFSEKDAYHAFHNFKRMKAQNLNQNIAHQRSSKVSHLLSYDLEITNLDISCTSTKLRALFSDCQDITGVLVVGDKYEPDRAVGHVSFFSLKSALNAQITMKGKVFEGKEIIVTLAKRSRADLIRIYVDHLKGSCTETELMTAFSRFGDIAYISTIPKRSTLLKTCIGFVTNEAAINAVKEMNGKNINNNPITVSIGGETSTRLFAIQIENLEHTVSTGELRAEFDKFGSIAAASMANSANNTNRQSACIKFLSQSSAINAIKGMHGKIVQGTAIKVAPHVNSGLEIYTVIIKHPSGWSSEKELMTHFERFAEIAEVQMDAKEKGHGTVSILFFNQTAAINCIESMNNTVIDGIPVSVLPAKDGGLNFYRIRINNLGSDVTTKHLESAFHLFGKIADAYLEADGEAGSTGYVSFCNEESALDAVHSTNNQRFHIFNFNPIRVVPVFNQVS